MNFQITQVIREFSTAGGAETVAWELQRAWTRAGMRSTVLACVTDGTGGTAETGTIMLVSPWLSRIGTRGAWRYAGRLLAVPGFTLAATWALRSRRDSVIVSHGDSLSGDVLVVHAVNKTALRAKRRAGQWRWMLNPMHLWVGVRDRWLFGGGGARPWDRLRFDTVIAVSNRVRDELVEEYRVPAGRIRVISNGIALDRFQPDAAAGQRVRHAFGIPGTAKVMLFVGHEFSRKGLAYAVGALTRLPEDTWLVVVGADEGAAYRRQAGAVAPRLVFTGPRTDLAALYSAADAFVFPTAYETFSLVCMEAMACGVPVFATAVGGIEDYLVDGVNGRFTPGRGGSGGHSASRPGRPRIPRQHGRRRPPDRRIIRLGRDRCAVYRRAA